MRDDACILTTKDFTILEVMLDRCGTTDEPTAAVLRRKIRAATVVFHDDIPAGIATLSSRVTYRVNTGIPDTRILSHDRMNSPTGLFLPINSPVGLALLGLAEGQEFCIDRTQRITLDGVLYQPEEARRERILLARMVTPAARRAAIRVVSRDEKS